MQLKNLDPRFLVEHPQRGLTNLTRNRDLEEIAQEVNIQLNDLLKPKSGNCKRLSRLAIGATISKTRTDLALQLNRNVSTHTMLRLLQSLLSLFNLRFILIRLGRCEAVLPFGGKCCHNLRF